MYFEVENTPPAEKQRKNAIPQRDEVCVLTLLPFSAAPTISFDGVPVGRRVSKSLYISNPKANDADVSVSTKSPEPELELSWTETRIPPHQTVELVLSWTPGNVCAHRAIVQVSDKRKGKYDVPVVCRSIDVKSNANKGDKKKSKPSNLRKSPLKPFKKKSPKSVACLYFGNVNKTKNIERELKNDMFVIRRSPPANMRMKNTDVTARYDRIDTENETRRDTYLIQESYVKEERYYESIENETYFTPVRPQRTSKEREIREKHDSVLNAIENIEFTPSKVYNNYVKKYTYDGNQENHYTDQNNKNIQHKDVEINVSYNSNITHPIINLIDSNISFSPTSFECKDTNRYVSPYRPAYHENKPNFNGIPSPDTYFSSNPNFLSVFKENVYQTPLYKKAGVMNSTAEHFDPKLCSTEKKVFDISLNKDMIVVCDTENDGLKSCDASLNATYKRLSSETYTKGDSPIVPLIAENVGNLQSSPYSPRNLVNEFNSKNNNVPVDIGLVNYNERATLRNIIREKNSNSKVRDVIEANLWQRSPPRNVSPTPLSSIPEESSSYSETTYTLDVKPHSSTFVLDRTFDKNSHPIRPANTGWSKTVVNKYPKVSKSHIDSSSMEEITRLHRANWQVDVYSLASVVDPFMASTCLYDEEAFDKLESDFKKWLNYLLTPPSDLDTKVDLDIGKAWLENRCKSVPAAPTKEQISSKYMTSHRLESLRKSAVTLITSSEISQVFIKVSSQVEKRILVIRDDRNLHVDIGLQKVILGLLLSYNPLWLRIGLEALYGKNIKLASNNDIGGLTDFIIENMFKDPYITSKHLLIHPTHSEKLKKFTLKKFLFLVYFLDKAKEKKIIFHDPCLFCRNAQYKESKQLLFQFTKEMLSGVGDITKHLRPTGYVVTHKQTYIQEFKYAVHNLAVDLKDGVRLTRLMEVILMKENLTDSLRVPAISRLQKVHNVNIALSALAAADFQIVGDITAKDIADGHREKTLSLLWQLINKFRAPLFESSALTIQRWWRRHYLKVWLKNRIAYKKQLVLINAASTIQSWWRSVLHKRETTSRIYIETRAATVIQKYWRMYNGKINYKKTLSSAIVIQKHFKKILTIRRAKLELQKLRQERAASKIQKFYKAWKTGEEFKRKNRDQLRSLISKTMSPDKYNIVNADHFIFVQKRFSTVMIQKWFRNIMMKRENVEHQYYSKLKHSVVLVQRIYRANLLMKKERHAFLELRMKTIKIQQIFRSKLLTRSIQYDYIKLKQSTILIQNLYRAKLMRNECRQQYLEKRRAANVIQSYFRNYLIAKETQKQYLNIKSSTVVIQRWFRQRLLIKRDRNAYLNMLEEHRNLTSNATKIQLWYRKIKSLERFNSTNDERHDFLQKRKSAMIIQKWFKNIITTRNNSDLQYYVKLKHSIVQMQRMYRAKSIMEKERSAFLILKMNAIKIQRYYRSFVSTRKIRTEYLELKRSTVLVQNMYRAKLMMNQCRKDYLKNRNAAVVIQKYYRNYILKRDTRKQYLTLKQCTILIQRKFRQNLLMKRDRCAYLRMLEENNRLNTNAAKIQMWYRKIKSLQKFNLENQDRHQLLLKKDSSVLIQRWFRNIITIRRNVDYQYYVKLRSTVVQIQRIYRAKIMMKKEKEIYITMRTSAITIQKYYRSVILTRTLRKEFITLKQSAIIIQNAFRSKMIMNDCRNRYLKKKKAATVIQSHFKNYMITKRTRQQYLTLKYSAIIIQRTFRRKLLMDKDRNAYLQSLRQRKEQNENAIRIQRWFRNIKSMERFNSVNIDRQTFLQKKHAALLIQNWFRSVKVCKENADRRYFKELIRSVIRMQQMYRANIIMKNERQTYIDLKESAVKIQRFYRSVVYTRRVRAEFVELKKKTIFIQNLFRAKSMGEKCRCEYLEMKNAAVAIQKYFRNYMIMKETRRQYLTLIAAVLVIQKKYRQKLLARNAKNRAALIIQKCWRGYNIRKKQQDNDRAKQLRLKWKNNEYTSNEPTLGERNSDALYVLSRFKDMASIIRAFKTLDFVTDVYPMMYTVDEVNHISRSLIIYMDSTNRSVATLETIHLGIAILTNLIRYKHSARHAFNIKYLDIILSLMVRWSEKDSVVLCALCTLLWLCAKYPDIKREVAAYMKRDENYKVMCKIRTLVLRKRKMDDRKRNAQKSNVSLQHCNTPVKSNRPSRIIYPMEEPDFGMSKRPKPKFFVETVDAIDSVFLMYDIPLNVFVDK